MMSPQPPRLIVGGVYTLTNRNLHKSRRNNKMHIYIGKYESADQFLLVNSKETCFFNPHHRMLKENYPFLKYDSYICCNANRGIQALSPPYKINKQLGRLKKDDLEESFNLLCEDGLDDDKKQCLGSCINRY